MRTPIRPWLILLLAVLLLQGCGQKPTATTADVVVASRQAIPADPADAAWENLPVHVSPLLLQDIVDPRLLAPSTREVRMRAVTDGSRIAFRLEWIDPTRDDLPGAARFSDACAVQLPAQAGADAPAPQMGENGRPVEITFWRASWQATVDGRKDTITELYPGATVDHYPFEAASLEKGSAVQREMAARYAPALALGNRMAGPREQPVEDLIAEGPGTLTPAKSTVSSGRGVRTADGWRVVISRPLPQSLAPGKRSQVAFAVWEGSRQEAGARKMRTGWVPLSMEATK
jgi:DMSO reductase family type II enzyme heme b subunit